jgi:hypothetical protein
MPTIGEDGTLVRMKGVVYFPSALKKLVMKCLERHPEDRCTIEEIGDMLVDAESLMNMSISTTNDGSCSSTGDVVLDFVAADVSTSPSGNAQLDFTTTEI